MPNPQNDQGGAVSPLDPDAHLQRLLPRLNLDLPWYRSLYHNLKDLLHAPRLPPLEVTSRPVAVKDIWGLYGRQKKSFLLSTAFQMALVALVVWIGISRSKLPIVVANGIKQVFFDSQHTPAHPQPHHGGGGGGDRSPIPANHGLLANSKPREFTAPIAVYHNLDPVITFDPNIVGDPHITDVKQSDIGDPFGAIGPRSNGGGSGNGIGNGRGGGQGPGNGPGSGPNDGSSAGGINSPVYTAGHKGLVNPVLLFKREPDYSDDARKAKLQGTVELEVVVDSSGRPQVRRVVQSLGLGLDEQAIKAVRTWRFQSGTMDGKPVPVVVHIVITFRLL